MRVLEYHSDDGCRPGCHPVTLLSDDRKGRPLRRHCFSVDEPGAWFDDAWNCHADGTDHRCASREEAVRKGAEILYDERFHGSPAVVVVFRKQPFRLQDA